MIELISLFSLLFPFRLKKQNLGFNPQFAFTETKEVFITVAGLEKEATPGHFLPSQDLLCQVDVWDCMGAPA